VERAVKFYTEILGMTIAKTNRDDAARKMKDWGVKVYSTPKVDRPTGRGCYFFDSDDNLLQLYAPPKTQPTS